MSKPFSTARRSSRIMSVTMKGGEKLAKRLSKLEDGGKKALELTMSDFVSRAPGWVAKGIRQHYGVDRAAIDKAGPRKRRGAVKMNIAGIAVDGVSLQYEGHLLTPTHFKMKPTTAPTARNKKPIRVPGQAIAGNPTVAMIRPLRQYKIRATILKGHRASMPSGAYLSKVKKKIPQEDDVHIPFQRVGDVRKPVEAIHTLSVPQMISGKAKETIDELKEKNTMKLLEHHIDRMMR